jgi:HK97 family phage portal protein
MPLLDGVFAPRAATLESPLVPMTGSNIVDLFMGGDHRTSAGVAVTEIKSLGIPAVWRAVQLIASTSASLPLHPYRATDFGGRALVPTGQAARLLDDPHPDLTPFELWELAFCHVALWGNAYLRILRNDLGQIRELWPIHPSRVKAGRSSETGVKLYSVDGSSDALTDREILHIPGFGYDGVCGVSPIRAARMGLGLALAAEEYGAKFFGSGSLATGILQTEQRLTQPQADALHARWKAKRSGLQSAHEVIVLDSGAKFEQLSIPPEDAQFLETRSFQVAEIARMFGIPPHMLQDTDKSTSWGTGIEQQSIGFVVYTLRPWLLRFEQRITKILKPEPVFARFSVEGLLRGDSKARADFYRRMWEIGAYSTNEIRALEDLAPVDGGDARHRPLNMGELGTFDADLDATLEQIAQEETSNA